MACGPRLTSSMRPHRALACACLLSVLRSDVALAQPSLEGGQKEPEATDPATGCPATSTHAIVTLERALEEKLALAPNSWCRLAVRASRCAQPQAAPTWSLQRTPVHSAHACSVNCTQLWQLPVHSLGLQVTSAASHGAAQASQTRLARCVSVRRAPDAPLCAGETQTPASKQCTARSTRTGRPTGRKSRWI